ncbi:hypothetical protein BAY61_06565 [Prauserella marina]|uniref:Uncharacterized protein n=1 Tax=Prauserella marina TaxID=530584 RepID=A0A222VLD6_9PSEU|nr:DUF6801 domain-containing protein [Prauserella marina]ASR34697.1 hypothetical protein BAY61_06565 [Prauserella marina]PWV85644.1 hypothetical protein DES30_1011672 [Prauserella marina]SDC49546.1 hypothetical protein SAMN05421630_102319 [Prauserella marina]
MSRAGSRPRRAILVSAPLIAGLLAAGLVSQGSALAGQQVELALGYTCHSPTTSYPATVTVKALFPANAVTGQPVAVEAVNLDVVLPEVAAAELRGQGATMAGGTAALSVTASGAESSWPDLAIPATALPEAGELTLAASGPVPAIEVAEPGELTVSAGALALSLNGFRADGSSAEPPVTAVACELQPEQNAVLATLPVGGESTAPDSSTPETPGAEPGDSDAKSMPRAEGLPLPGVQQETPENCFEVPVEDPSPYLGCAFQAGYANVKKLNGAVLLGSPEPMLMRVDYGVARGNQPCDAGTDRFGDYTCTGAIVTHSRLTLDVPTADPTLLSFGFVPVKAKVAMTVSEENPIIAAESRIEQRLYTADNFRRFPLLVRAEGMMTLRMYDVEVNGVPLDVGPDCRSAHPFTVVFNGQSAQAVPILLDEYSVAYGGVITGTITIPPFSGCGVTEDLDPLLTGTVSGPGNYTRVSQGDVCFKLGNGVCPPPLADLGRD